MIENIGVPPSRSAFPRQVHVVTQLPPLTILSCRDFSARSMSCSAESPNLLPAPPNAQVTENVSPHHSISDFPTVFLTRSPTLTTSDSLHSIKTARNRSSDQRPIRSVGRKEFLKVCDTTRSITASTPAPRLPTHCCRLYTSKLNHPNRTLLSPTILQFSPTRH